jgi:hypothetical protein
MIILNKILQVASDNLFKIVERFMVEYRCELALQTSHNLSEIEMSCRTDFPAIYFNNMLEGWVQAFPLTFISSRVVVEANKNDGEEAPEMHKLSNFILEIVGEGLKEQPAAGIRKEVSTLSELSQETVNKENENKESENTLYRSTHNRIAPTRQAGFAHLESLPLTHLVLYRLEV